MDSIIKVDGIRKIYKMRKTKEIFVAVDDVSFEVEKGEILGLLGPNGAGKTTTIKTICGLLVPDEGAVTINGFDSVKKRNKALRHISAVLEGNRNLYWRMTVEENLEYFAGNRGMSRKAMKPHIDKLLEQFRLKEKRQELVNKLSRGMQQKLAIAVAMLADTDVILLDEPTLGLDVETGYEVREILRSIAKKEGKTIIISTHDMPVVQDLCERTVIINNGRVIADESVDHLLQLFKTSAYQISLKEPITDEQQEMLKFEFPLHSWKGLDLQVSLEEEQEIYALMDILKRNHTPIETINRTEINFEKVFMQLVKEEAAS
ncbi:daunorubicin resistance protein DrrA family ABC transporter ATP-binding protein [Thalassobacillus devorans]|uniref:Daunorubicin resistance protein DrrA family ABC transporter ATP-binding protein n=1 Tax=Thalassobacillus devorans TaxID=279813 RepID=A0ABQ1PPS9_9BACI|nr:ABC transporter ATP-binding protein [Thalassobacillus devorans]NIK30390.1 ABC-2 type transport system ATP-binding protein [Thalassobacillus devorans]GGD00654.1 daunorubicin resistance protein DrrA family ABC transporter ATP-binding protein [Thalassobacillus devorans]